MRKIIILLLGALLMSFFITSCDKDGHNHTHEEDGEATVAVKFDHVWGMGSAAFALNTELEHPMTGDTITMTTLKYYVTNLKLKDMDGNWWSEEESYHLVDASDASSTTITLNDVPAIHYVELSYTIGVDSARNVAGAQTGALSPSNNMFWSWNSGYIMAMFEGTEGAAVNSFAYHCGGFTGANNSIRVNSCDFGGSHLMLSDGDVKTVTISANPAKIWHTIGSVANNNASIHMPNATTSTIMDDFSGSFMFDNVQ